MDIVGIQRLVFLNNRVNFTCTIYILIPGDPLEVLVGVVSTWFVRDCLVSDSTETILIILGNAFKYFIPLLDVDSVAGLVLPHSIQLLLVRPLYTGDCLSEIVEFCDEILLSVNALGPRVEILAIIIFVQKFDFGSLVGTIIIGQRALSIDCEHGPGMEVPVPVVTVFGLFEREFFLDMLCLERDHWTCKNIGLIWSAGHLFWVVGKPAIFFGFREWSHSTTFTLYQGPALEGGVLRLRTCLELQKLRLAVPGLLIILHLIPRVCQPANANTEFVV